MSSQKSTEFLRPANLAWIVLIIAIAGVILFQALPGPHPLDDSFITFRYARNIHSGMGYVYNPGERVQGTTTPLYTLLLTFSSILFGSKNLPFISFGIALVADVLNTWLLYRIARYLLKQEWAAFIVATVFLLQPLRLNVAAGGMETSLFITLLLAMYERYLVGQKIYQAAIFGALAILTRPDAVLAVGPVFLHALWKNRPAAWKAGLLGIAILAPWYAWAAWYFGNPIPASILSKAAVYQNYSPGATLLLLLTFLGTGTVGPYRELMVIFPGLVVALFLVIIGLMWVRKGNWDSAVVIVYPLLYYFVMTVQHAPLFFSWYYLPLMPGFLLLFFGAFLHLFPGSPQVDRGNQRKILCASFGLVLIIFPAILMKVFPGWADSRQMERLYQKASNSIQDRAAGRLVFAPDIGVIGWNLGGARILDPIGLVSPVSLTYLDKFRGTDSASYEEIRDLQPDFVIAREGFISSIILNPGFSVDYQLIWQEKVAGGSDEKVVVYERK